MTRAGHALLTVVGGACLALGCSGATPRDKSFGTDAESGFEVPPVSVDAGGGAGATGGDQGATGGDQGTTAGTGGGAGATAGAGGGAGASSDAAESSGSDGGAA